MGVGGTVMFDSHVPAFGLPWLMRFLHVADVHLDTSFSGRSEGVRQRLRDASREAFAAAVDLAIHEEVHAFLIAGDLFDGDRFSFRSERFLLDQLTRLTGHGITVVYATGNHDPGNVENAPRRLTWPASVHVAADRTPRRFLINDREGTPVGYVTSIGHATDRETEDLSRLLPRPVGTLPEVGLLHTQVRSSPGSDAHRPYAPSEVTYLLRAGFDYWALGHVHSCQSLCDDPPIWYSGCLQGRTHTDQGERGALLVDVSDRDHPLVQFRGLAPVRWETVTVGDLGKAASLDELERLVQLAWQRERSSAPASGDMSWMVRVALVGPCPLWAELRTPEDRAVLADELKEILGVLDVVVVSEGVYPVAPIAEYATRTDVLGETLRLVEAVRQGDITLDIDRANLVGASGDDRESVAAYVRSLLEGADGEVASRLLGGL